MTPQRSVIRDKFSNEGMNFSFPSKREISKLLKENLSRNQLTDYKNKLYEDEIYGKKTINCDVNYATLNGNWQIDLSDDEFGYYLKLIPESGSPIHGFISLSFPTVADRIIFLNEMNAEKPVEQINAGIDAENIINLENSYAKKALKITSLVAITSLVTIFAQKLVKRKK